MILYKVGYNFKDGGSNHYVRATSSAQAIVFVKRYFMEKYPREHEDENDFPGSFWSAVVDDDFGKVF